MHHPNILVWAEHSLLNLQRLSEEGALDWHEISRFRRELAKDAQALLDDAAQPLEIIELASRMLELTVLLLLWNGNDYVAETLHAQVAAVRVAVTAAIG